MDIYDHPETFIELGQIGKVSHGYRPTFLLGDKFIDDFHKSLVEMSEGGLLNVDGYGKKLKRADALKLYELAYMTTGNVIELGSGDGLTAFIIAMAIKNSSPPPRMLTTVDGNNNATTIARASLTRKDLTHLVSFVTQDPVKFMKESVGASEIADLVLIRGVTARGQIEPICKLLVKTIMPGGFAMFLNLNDRRNTGKNPVYHVYRATQEFLSKNDFKFLGIYGSCGCYRRCMLS